MCTFCIVNGECLKCGIKRLVFVDYDLCKEGVVIDGLVFCPKGSSGIDKLNQPSRNVQCHACTEKEKAEKEKEEEDAWVDVDEEQ